MSDTYILVERIGHMERLTLNRPEQRNPLNKYLVSERMGHLRRSEIGSFSPLALRVGLRAFNETTDMEFNRAVDHLNTLRLVLSKSEDLREGATAFLEKRPPRWKGR